MSIDLKKILTLSNPLTSYKLHLACWNGSDQPLDVFVRSRDEWDGWTRYRGDRDDFSREYVLSFMEFYPEPETWLFGGTYKISARDQESYTIQVHPDGKELIGRLKVALKRPGRVKAFKLENYFDQMIVSEVLKEVYSGERFCGYENINHAFRDLEPVFKNCRPEWKAALENVKGVYLITDTSNGKRYVGSAYGGAGIWSRWANYMHTGHGWNDELTKLIDELGMDYARQNFRLALLEYRAMKTDDQAILAREKYWKDTLLTRGQFGYNKN